GDAGGEAGGEDGGGGGEAGGGEGGGGDRARGDDGGGGGEDGGGGGEIGIRLAALNTDSRAVTAFGPLLFPGCNPFRLPNTSWSLNEKTPLKVLGFDLLLCSSSDRLWMVWLLNGTGAPGGPPP